MPTVGVRHAPAQSQIGHVSKYMYRPREVRVAGSGWDGDGSRHAHEDEAVLIHHVVEDGADVSQTRMTHARTIVTNHPTRVQGHSHQNRSR
jgi:hypothetical protein